MARPRQIDPQVAKRARRTAATSTSVEPLRQCQAVLLPALFGATLEQTAAVLGVGRATVARLQTTFRRKRPAGPHPSRNWGGRRQSLLTPEKESTFLKPWLESAAAGNLVVVAPIRAALAQQLGQPVKPSVVYRLLARQGWRKGGPRHTTSQERPRRSRGVGKKLPKRWRPRSAPTWSKGVTSG
jgi:transposase